MPHKLPSPAEIAAVPALENFRFNLSTPPTKQTISDLSRALYHSNPFYADLAGKHCGEALYGPVKAQMALHRSQGDDVLYQRHLTAIDYLAASDSAQPRLSHPTDGETRYVPGTEGSPPSIVVGGGADNGGYTLLI